MIVNEKVQNVFWLDFSPAQKITAVSDSSKKYNSADVNKAQDSLIAKKDTLQVLQKDSIKIPTKNITALPEKQLDKTEIKKPEVNKVVDQKDKPPVINIPKEKIKEPEIVLTAKIPDSTFNKWKKATVKIYESMDAKKVAKIIKNLSDNEARELIYSMKKKKAAEILSNLDADTVKRITRLQ